MIDFLFSCEAQVYHRWQAELLAHSFAQSQQPGRLLGICSQERDPAPHNWQCPIYSVRNYRRDPLEGDYTPLNKPGGLLEWLEREKPKPGLVCLLDPDCLFTAPLEVTLPPHTVVVNPISYPEAEKSRELILKRHCAAPFREAVQLSIVPAVLALEDLSLLAPLWFQKTLDIRADLPTRAAAGWIAEMWAFAIAISSCGLRQIYQKMACFNHLPGPLRPIIHYCYPMGHENGKSWNKTDYRPWEIPPAPSAHSPLAQRYFLQALADLAAKNQHQGLDWDLDWG